jgi:hypothetical protein
VSQKISNLFINVVGNNVFFFSFFIKGAMTFFKFYPVVDNNRFLMF